MAENDLREVLLDARHEAKCMSLDLNDATDTAKTADLASHLDEAVRRHGLLGLYLRHYVANTPKSDDGRIGYVDATYTAPERSAP